MRRAQGSHLLDLLLCNDVLRTRGFSLSRTQEGSIVVDRFGHVHGIWNYDGRQYAWTSPSSSEPIFHTDSPSAAVVYTLLALSQT
jgi:hypothetical protein